MGPQRAQNARPEEPPWSRSASSWTTRWSRDVLEGIVADDRVVVAYSQNDIAGAYSRDNFGNWEFECDPGGAAQRERAFRLGINLVMYALCNEYKSDQVHVEFIMRRRQWRSGDDDQSSRDVDTWKRSSRPK